MYFCVQRWQLFLPVRRSRLTVTWVVEIIVLNVSTGVSSLSYILCSCTLLPFCCAPFSQVAAERSLNCQNSPTNRIQAQVEPVDEARLCVYLQPVGMKTPDLPGGVRMLASALTLKNICFFKAFLFSQNLVLCSQHHYEFCVYCPLTLWRWFMNHNLDRKSNCDGRKPLINSSVSAALNQRSQSQLMSQHIDSIMKPNVANHSHISLITF